MYNNGIVKHNKLLNITCKTARSSSVSSMSSAIYRFMYCSINLSSACLFLIFPVKPAYLRRVRSPFILTKSSHATYPIDLYNVDLAAPMSLLKP